MDRYAETTEKMSLSEFNAYGEALFKDFITEKGDPQDYRSYVLECRRITEASYSMLKLRGAGHMPPDVEDVLDILTNRGETSDMQLPLMCVRGRAGDVSPAKFNSWQDCYKKYLEEYLEVREGAEKPAGPVTVGMARKACGAAEELLAEYEAERDASVVESSDGYVMNTSDQITYENIGRFAMKVDHSDENMVRNEGAGKSAEEKSAELKADREETEERG